MHNCIEGCSLGCPARCPALWRRAALLGGLHWLSLALPVFISLLGLREYYIFPLSVSVICRTNSPHLSLVLPPPASPALENAGITHVYTATPPPLLTAFAAALNVPQSADGTFSLPSTRLCPGLTPGAQLGPGRWVQSRLFLGGMLEKGAEQRVVTILMTCLLRRYCRRPYQVEFWKG